MKRLLCHLWGCCCANEYPGCVRCGAALYDADFIQIGRLNWLIVLRYFIIGLWSDVMRRCEVCGKRVWFTRHSPCCSEKCFSKWYPF